MDRVVFAVSMLVGARALSACSPPTLPPQAEPPAVKLEPAAGKEGAPSVVRVHVTGLGPVDPNAVVLFRGELSAYHAGRIRAVALPQTLSDLRVPGVAWGDAATGLVLAPSERLAAGETYSVAALGYGALASFVVAADSGPYAGRIWPPHAAMHGGKRWVLCGEAPLPPPGTRVLLAPAGARAVVAPGADSAMTKADACFRLELTDLGAGGLAVAPPEVAGTAMDPAPVFLVGGSPLPDGGLGAAPPADPGAAMCLPSETPLGPGCAKVLDDRIVVRASGAPLLWAVTYATTELVVSTDPGGQFVLAGLTPLTQIALLGSATDLEGNETPFQARLTTQAPLPHLVVNEVLANPNGVEKDGEWVELFNDGTSAVDVTGWSLADPVRAAVLPRGTLAPGAYALLVSAGYDPSSSADVPPAPGTLILRVSELGSGGLSNQGEQLELRAPDGTVVSRFPAVAASKSGVSIARRAPASRDDALTEFGPSAPPGASPGAVNVLAAR
jgi:hypothetical protein